jgi:toxoflavin synthase
MLGMCRSAYANLVAGGRFVAYTVNPAFTLSKPNSTKYGVTVLGKTFEEDRYVCDAEFVTDPPTPFQYFQWGQATHEWAMQEAGFRACAWHLMWLYSPGHTETRSSHSRRGVFDESIHNEKISR